MSEHRTARALSESDRIQAEKIERAWRNCHDDLVRLDAQLLDMVTDLHVAVYGDTWARPESPEQVWEMLLEQVRGLASGRCGECERRAARAAAAGSATPGDVRMVAGYLPVTEESLKMGDVAGPATPTGDDDG